MLHCTGLDPAVAYRQEPTPVPEASVPVGTTSRAGLPSFLSSVQRSGAWDALAQYVRLPVQERRTGFTHLQKSQALVTALAAGCRHTRESDFVLGPDPLAAGLLGLPRWPHSSALTRHLRAFRPQHVAALRAASEAVLAQHSQVRWRLRRTARAHRAHWVVVDCDQMAISANGRTYTGTAKGHLKKKGDRGYQATVAFAGEPSGGGDEVLAVFLDPGNTHASRRFPDVLAALERVLGPVERRPNLVLRFDCQYATADDLALLLRRGIRFVGRNYADATAAGWARALGPDARWQELSPIKWVCELGAGPVSPARPDVCCRRLLVRSTGARQRLGYTAIVTNIPADELPTLELEPFYEQRQTIEGWLSEATAALQLKGLWSRTCEGIEAFLLHAALASNLLNWWERRELLPDSGLPPLGLRQVIGRIITLPARVVATPTGQLLLVLPPQHPYARRLVPAAASWQLPLPLFQFILRDAHF
jgi:Transposase DDE domain group 1